MGAKSLFGLLLAAAALYFDWGKWTMIIWVPLVLYAVYYNFFRGEGRSEQLRAMPAAHSIRE